MLWKLSREGGIMNVAMLLAGGTGQRLGKAIPKQFVEMLGKPLIVHALDIYERSPHIDAIEVVCIPEYIDTVMRYRDQYGISKLRWVVSGGASCQESTKNGIFALKGHCSDDDVVMIGMSTSVFVSEDIIKDSLDTCAKYGNAFCAMQSIYNLATTTDGLTSSGLNRKETHKTLNMPWTAPFGTYYRLYKEAYEKGIETDSAAYAPTLFLAMGETLYLSKDTTKNKLHVTTPEDLDIVKACLLFDREERARRKIA